MAKWATVANPLNSTNTMFGGKWGNDLSRYLNGIDMGAIDSDKEPHITTNTRYGYGKLKLYDIDSTHTVEFQPENIISGANRVLKIRPLTVNPDYIVTEHEPATLYGKTLSTNTKLSAVLDAAQNSIIKIDSVGLRDLDATNVNLVNISGTGVNSTINILKNYAGILGATDIKVQFGESSKINAFEWYSTIPGPSSKLFDILPNQINTYVDLDMNGNQILNYVPIIPDNHIVDSDIAAHTTTKISVLTKALLHPQIVYKDQTNTYADHDQIFVSGNLKVAGNGGFNTSFLSNTLAGNVSVTLPNATGILALASDPRFTDARTPLGHATSHKSGSDLIRINELAAAIVNNPATNATTIVNGTLRILSGDATQYLNGAGSWSVPTLPAGQFSGDIKGSIATVAGNGTTKTFLIPHGLGTIPASAIVKPSSVDAFGEFTTSVDGTNISITYQVAPPGDGVVTNLSWQWIAMDPAAGLSVRTSSTVGGGLALTKTVANGNLPFRSLLAGSQKITLVQNNNDITFDIDETEFTTARPPTNHAVNHRVNGGDVIKINELAPSTTNTPATNSTELVNGTMPVLHGDPNYYLNGDGTWSVPTGLGGGAGESNTVSNLVGTAGYVGLFKQKTLVDFEFKSLNTGSNKVTLVDDTPNNQVLIDINPSTFIIDYTQLENIPEFARLDTNNIFGDFQQEFPSAGIKIMNSLRTFGTIIENSEITGENRIIRLPLLTGLADTIVVENLPQSLANKTLVAPIMTTIKVGAETITLPTVTTTLVGRNTADVLTNKELTAPKIATIINNNNVLVLPTIADTLMGRSTTDTESNKTISMAANTITDASAALGDIPVHNGTKFVRRGKGVDGTFLGVQAGVVGYYTPPAPSAGVMPDGSQIPATGRWGALWGGNLIGMGMIGFSATYATTSTLFVSATEAATIVNTAALDDAEAYVNTGGILSRQSNINFKAKWAARQNSGMVVRVGLTSNPLMELGGGHDSPLDGISGVMLVYVSDLETNYRVARNSGATSDTDTTTSVAGGNQLAHTCEIILNSSSCTVIIDGGTILNAVTTNLPATTTPLYAFLHIESIGNSIKGLAVHRAQVTML